MSLTPPQTAVPSGSRVAVALWQALSPGYPVCPARASLSGVDGGVPDSVFPVLSCESAQSGCRGAKGPPAGFSQVRSDQRRPAPVVGRQCLSDQRTTLGTATAHHRPGFRRRETAPFLWRDVGCRRGDGGPGWRHCRMALSSSRPRPVTPLPT